jgi:hypothetical protein
MKPGPSSSLQWIWIAVGLGFAALGLGLIAGSPPPVVEPVKNGAEAIVLGVDTVSHKLIVRHDADQPIVTMPPDVAATVDANLNAGDSVWVIRDDTAVTGIALKRIRIGWTYSVGALSLSFAVIWVGILLVTLAHPWSFALGIDFRLSNSQTQIYFWFVTFGTVFLAETVLRVVHVHYFGGIGAPARLLALSGISALTFVGARANATFKDAPGDAAAARAAGRPPPKGIPPGAIRTRWNVFLDLFTNDSVDQPNGRYDLGDFQMIVLTWAAIAMYLTDSALNFTDLIVASHVDLPPVDDTLLGGTAVSHGAYLFKKAVSPPGR